MCGFVCEGNCDCDERYRLKKRREKKMKNKKTHHVDESLHQIYSMHCHTGDNISTVPLGPWRFKVKLISASPKCLLICLHLHINMK